MIPVPISARALEAVRSRAEMFMRYTCRIERVTPPGFDETTLVATPGSRTTVYTGVCRLRDISGAMPVAVGDVDIVLQNTILSIPFDTDVVPRRDDEVQILSVPEGGDPAVLDKRFQIQDAAKAGELRAVRAFSVIAMERTQ